MLWQDACEACASSWELFCRASAPLQLWAWQLPGSFWQGEQHASMSGPA